MERTGGKAGTDGPASKALTNPGPARPTLVSVSGVEIRVARWSCGKTAQMPGRAVYDDPVFGWSFPVEGSRHLAGMRLQKARQEHHHGDDTEPAE
jgi:hypothetical protein